MYMDLYTLNNHEHGYAFTSYHLKSYVDGVLLDVLGALALRTSEHVCLDYRVSCSSIMLW